MAKTLGKLPGNLIMVSADGEQIACTTNATFNATIERIETTCKDDDGAKTYEAGSMDGTIEVQGIAIVNTTTNFALIAEKFFNKEEGTWQYGSLDNVDDPYIQLDGFISDLTWEGPLNAPSTWSFTVVPTGRIYLFNT